jgi:hypothetical protein
MWAKVRLSRIFIVFLIGILASVSNAGAASSCAGLVLSRDAFDLQSFSQLTISQKLDQRRTWLSAYLLRQSLRQLDLKNFATDSSEDDIRRATDSVYDQLTGVSLFKGLDAQALQWAEKSVLFYGFQSYIKSQELRAPNGREKLAHKISRITESRIVRYLTSPIATWFSPDQKDIEKELADQILMEGAEAHKIEIQDAFRKTGQKRRLNGLRVSSIVSAALTCYIAYNSVSSFQKSKNTTIEMASKIQYGQMMDGLDHTSQSLEALDKVLEKKGFYSTPK